MLVFSFCAKKIAPFFCIEILNLSKNHIFLVFHASMAKSNLVALVFYQILNGG